MAVIQVPKPQGTFNPDRPAGCLLKAQVEHVHAAEKKLPLRYRMNIDGYANAVQTEREAAEYIGQVTEAIHRAHDEAAAKREKRAPSRKRTVEIAASAEKPLKSRGRKTAAKSKRTQKSRKGRK